MIFWKTCHFTLQNTIENLPIFWKNCNFSLQYTRENLPVFWKNYNFPSKYSRKSSCFLEKLYFSDKNAYFSRWMVGRRFFGKSYFSFQNTIENLPFYDPNWWQFWFKNADFSWRMVWEKMEKKAKMADYSWRIILSIFHFLK